MKHDIALLDRQIKFLQEQAVRLRSGYATAQWAQAQANMFDGIRETLRVIRQEQQMTGLGGKRLEE